MSGFQAIRRKRVNTKKTSRASDILVPNAGTGTDRNDNCAFVKLIKIIPSIPVLIAPFHLG
jgi:hypothetical protein